MPNIIDRTISVGLLHAAASELMIRRAMQMHQAQGMRLRHEAKRALTDFNEAYKRFSRAYDRMQELATDKNIDQNTAQLFDTFLNDSGTLAMVSMLYFNATNESNQNWERNTEWIMNTLKSITLGTVDAPFSLEFINQFAPKI